MFKRLIAALVCLSFSFSNLQYVQAQPASLAGGDFSINQLPVPGTMVGESLPFAPLALKGLIVNPQKPLEFQFIVDTGKGPQDTASIQEGANQLVKYFLAGLTIPEGDLWVNLSPYEKNRMVPEALGQTDLGRDLLAQDYILKQLSASLIYPEKDLGKEFWNRVYAKAQQQFGTTNVPVNSFNKVWILPDQAQVFEHGSAVYVTKATLKVMLDEDYLAKQKHQATKAASISSQVVREIVIPEITKEVNTGKNFALLRQIYDAMILAKWYKETIQNGLLDALYTNKDKIAGVNLTDPTVKEQIYQRYIQAYKKGVFNYIKEEPTDSVIASDAKQSLSSSNVSVGDPAQTIQKKYFSGGLTPMPQTLDKNGAMSAVKADGAMLSVIIILAVAAYGIAVAGTTIFDKYKELELIKILKKKYGDEYEDVIRRLIARNPTIASGSLLSYVEEAIQYKKEGYDFKVIFEPSHTYGDGDNFPNITQDEVLKIERGDKLQMAPTSTPSKDAAMLSTEITQRETDQTISDFTQEPIKTVRTFERLRLTSLLLPLNLKPTVESAEISDAMQWFGRHPMVTVGLTPGDMAMINEILQWAVNHPYMTANLAALMAGGTLGWASRSNTIVFSMVILFHYLNGIGISIFGADYLFFDNAPPFLLQLVFTGVSEASLFSVFRLLNVTEETATIRETRRKIGKLIRNKNYDGLLGFLANYRDMPYAVSEDLKEFIRDKEAQYQFGLAGIKSREFNVQILAEKMLEKSGKLTDPEVRYQIGLAEIKNESSNVRLWATGMLGDKRAIKPLLELLGDPYDGVRKEAVEVLEKLGASKEQMFQGYIGALASKSSGGRGEAVIALSKLGGQRAVEPLLGMLKDDNEHVRRAAAEALGKLGDQRAVEPLLGMLKDHYEYVRRAAAEALGKLGDQRAVEPLFGMLKDGGRERREAAEALGKLGRFELLVEQLLVFEKKQDYVGYNYIADVLHSLGNPQGSMIYRWVETKPAKGHYEGEYYDPYYGPIGEMTWVQDYPEEGYWEKQERSDAAMALAANKQVIPRDGLKRALAKGGISLDSIQDSRLRKFFEFLRRNGIDDIIVFGGAARDSFLGRNINDIDFTVKIDTNAAGGSLESIYNQADNQLERLSQSLSIPKSQFFDYEHPPQFEGVTLNYLGPTKLNGHNGKPQVVSRSFFDNNTGEMISSFTTPEILSFGLDNQGRLYGYRDALENWGRGIARLRGDARRNLTPRTVAKLLRLKHELGLTIPLDDYKALKGVPKDRDSGTIVNNYLQDDVKKVVATAQDPNEARKELIELGFDLAMLQTPKPTQDTAMLGLNWILFTDSQVIGELESRLAKYFAKQDYDTLVKLVHHKNGSVREKAAEALGNLGNKKAIEVLTPLLADSYRVRNSIVEALRKLGATKDQMLKGEIEVLKSQNAGAISDAINELVKFGDKRAIEPLMVLLKRSSVDKTVIQALEKLGANRKQIVGILKIALDDKEKKGEIDYFYGYNYISDQLHQLGDPAGDYIYTRTGRVLNPGAGRWEDSSYFNGSISAMGESKEWVSEEIREWQKVKRPDSAMLQSKSKDKDELTKTRDLGGIDLNQISIKRTGHVIAMQFDPAQLAQLAQGGFAGFTPVIINMRRISSLFEVIGNWPTPKTV